MTSDAELLSAARSDPNAFREVYDRYVERVHGYFVRRTGDEEAAFDLTAETFAQAWLVRVRFRDEADGSAAPWLFGIARNVLLMSLRRGQLERRAAQRLGLSEQVAVVLGTSASAARVRVHRGLAALRARYLDSKEMT
jgi:DNA-directed RNA polymerase specialized sigma24 family protein